jgi:hypothetical protein
MLIRATKRPNYICLTPPYAQSPAILGRHNYLYSPTNASKPSPHSHRVLCEAVSPYCFEVGEYRPIAQNPSPSFIKVQIIRRREGMGIYKSFITMRGRELLLGGWIISFNCTKSQSQHYKSSNHTMARRHGHL